jgi:hypothetical protein
MSKYHLTQLAGTYIIISPEDGDSIIKDLMRWILFD